MRESGENWFYESDGPRSIEVIEPVVRKKGKRKKGKKSKPRKVPFGFARALVPVERESGRVDG